MRNFKDEGTLTAMIHDCDEAISRHGARATIILRVPGRLGKQTHQRLFPEGPEGEILAQTNDHTKLIVLFVATEVKIKLEELKNDITTTANRD